MGNSETMWHRKRTYGVMGACVAVVAVALAGVGSPAFATVDATAHANQEPEWNNTANTQVVKLTLQNTNAQVSVPGGAMNDGTAVVLQNQPAEIHTIQSVSTSTKVGATPASAQWEWAPDDSSKKITDSTDGVPSYLYFGSLTNRLSGKCLDVANNTADEFSPLIQWTCNGGDNQKFAAMPVGSGGWALVALNTKATGWKQIGTSAPNCVPDQSNNAVVLRHAFSDPCTTLSIQPDAYSYATNKVGFNGSTYKDKAIYACMSGYHFITTAGKPAAENLSSNSGNLGQPDQSTGTFAQWSGGTPPNYDHVTKITYTSGGDLRGHTDYQARLFCVPN